MLNSLFSKSKQKILALLYLHPDRQFYLREIMRHSGVSQGTLHRELKPLARDGIVRSENRGNQVFYSANSDSPIYQELRNIVFKTFGVVGQLQDALSSLKKKIKIAFIYGSFAKGEETGASDIDLMVIGNTTLKEIVSTLAEPQNALGREINPTIYPTKEFRNKVVHGHHFVSTVLEDEKVFLIGGQRELDRLARSRLGS